MFKLLVYKNNELILDHAQPDFNKVLKFGVNSLIELVNNDTKDYRLTITDKEGNVYFSAIGEQTQIIGLRKNGTR